MIRSNGIRLVLAALLPAVLLAGGAALASGGDAAAPAADVARAAWLLDRGALQDLPLTGQLAASDEFGGGGAAATEPRYAGLGEGATRSGPLPVLASLVLPGAGEAMLGHKRGYVMMALDIFAWTRVAAKHSDGNDLRDEYYAYADEHYSDELLLAAYSTSIEYSDDVERFGLGAAYFPSFPTTIVDLTDLEELPLYVTKEEDRREYYENLGKWDQFVFGWDDFLSPESYAQLNPGYVPSGDPKIDFANPWVSENRETYRLMRDASNDAFKSRDRWLYLNIGLRLFSVVQTAWLGGILGGDGGDGGGSDRLSLGGHEVRLIAQPTGLRRATVAATVSF